MMIRVSPMHREDSALFDAECRAAFGDFPAALASYAREHRKIVTKRRCGKIHFVQQWDHCLFERMRDVDPAEAALAQLRKLVGQGIVSQPKHIEIEQFIAKREVQAGRFGLVNRRGR